VKVESLKGESEGPTRYLQNLRRRNPKQRFISKTIVERKTIREIGGRETREDIRGRGRITILVEARERGRGSSKKLPENL